MKKLQLLLASAALTSLLCISVGAGTMETGVAQPAPTPVPASVVTTSDMPEANGTMSTGIPSSEAVKEMALSVLQSVLALF